MTVTVHPRLPPELFRPILEGVNHHRPTLFALSLCSRFMKEEAERELYATLDETCATNSSLHVAFLSTIINNHHLASLVRIYHSINIVEDRERPLWDLLREAFQYMTGLKELYFRSVGGSPAGELLVGVPFALERLHWANHSEGDAMWKVLAQQSKLKYLYIELREGSVIPPFCVPELEELAGNRMTLEALLPGRRVHSVMWIPVLQDTSHGNDLAMKKALRNVVTLSYGGYFSRPHFSLVADYLHNLERLELIGLLSEEITLVKGLKALRELVFSFKWGSRYLAIPNDLAVRGKLVEELFTCCQALQCIDMAYDWTTVEEIWYQRWTRGKLGSKPDIVSLTQIKNEKMSKTLK